MIIVHLTGHMSNIRSMISNTLKVIDGMQIQGSLSCLSSIHLTLCKLDQILAKTALIFIDQIFLTLNLIILILLIIIQKIHRPVDIFAKLLGHTVHHTVTLRDRKSRIIKKTLLKKIEISLILQILLVIFNKPAYQLLDLRNEREQYNNCCQTEHSIQKCDCYRCHGHVHKCKMYDRISCIKDY